MGFAATEEPPFSAAFVFVSIIPRWEAGEYSSGYDCYRSDLTPLRPLWVLNIHTFTFMIGYRYRDNIPKERMFYYSQFHLSKALPVSHWR